MSLSLSVLVLFSLNGCGSGGYPGSGISSLSASAITIDAGQTIGVTATSGNLPVSWTLTGATCSGATCGTLSSNTGTMINYIAPTPVAEPFQVTLLAAINGTQSSRSVAITVNPAPAISGNPPAGTVGVAYSYTFTTSGGTAPLKLSLLSGSVPAGLTFDPSSGRVSGTPTATGTSSFTLQLVDTSDVPYTVTAAKQITIGAAGTGSGLSIVSGNPPTGIVGSPYTTRLQATGGTAPYTWSITGGALPAGLSLGAATGVISGTPTAAGMSTFTAQVTDATGAMASGSFSIVVLASAPTAPVITTGTLPSGTVNQPYSATIGTSGGTAPYTCVLAGGTLQTGLTLGSNCAVTGTPTVAGTANLMVKVTDSSNPSQAVTGAVSLTINPAQNLALSTGALPNGTVGTPYTGNVGVSGGTAPYACALVSGNLPTGLMLNANCSVVGTPTVAGSSTVMVRATDSSNPAQTTTGPQTITINPAPALTISSPPPATAGQPYTGTIPVMGGTAPYSCTLASGTLPAGLTLGAGCTVTGTPTTAGSVTVMVTATDGSAPSRTSTGPVVITVNPASGTLAIGNPPAATAGAPYTGTIPVSGGTAPYSCTIAGGTLPAGLALGANCTVSGTPTTPGSTTVMVTATDGSNPAKTTTGSATVTVNPSGTLSVGNPPAATVSTPYTGTIPVIGGTAPYSCTIASGTLPAGLALGANCTVAGTPTTAGSTTVMVTATDGSNPAKTVTAPVTITVNPAAGTLAVGNPPAATVSTPYTGTIPVTGGTAPYSCTIVSGTLPAGLALGANCTLTGTPTTAGSTTVMVTATDGSNPAKTVTGPATITINPAAGTLAVGNPPTATAGTPYTGTIPVTGGTAPYSCTIASGTLPAGLTLGANCTVTGTPTTAGSTTVMVTATDSSNPAKTVTGPATITVQAAPPVTLTGSLPNGVVNQAYSQTLQAAGGVGPYTYAVTAGTLPAGIMLSSGGVVSGTPTAPGASSFTVTATDSEGTPKSASLPLVLLITYAPTPNDSLLKGPYAFLFQGYDDVVAGVLAYQTATAGSITADGNGAITTGEEDSNHQASNPASNTVPTRSVLGTYTVGTDRRGMLTLTVFNADGTVATTTYAIALRAPVSPATLAASGSLIEYDGDQLAGTKGSGTLLAQTAAAFTAGLNGSYAFGISGDTPCLPSCTIGIAAGPVATVGQFSVAAGTVAGGTADTNIASSNTASSTLSGTAAAADTNGRVSLILNNAKLAGVSFPTDFAAYVVDSSHVILLSTDKHSAYILQAGTAQLQTQATFTNASLGAPFIGYENSPVSPGLLSTTLQNVLNLSTATVFRGTGAGNGTCSVTNVDSSGTTGIVNSLGGIVSAPVINALLGSYQSLGNSTCTVASNGRGVLNYPAPNAVLAITLGTLGLPATPAPRIVYLTAPNAGYFLESGYAGLGMLEAQTNTPAGAPYSNASFDGSFVYSGIPASTLATVDSSGVFTADGAGHTTSTIDRNVGVGTINVLQLGTTGAATYNITDTAAGRFALSTGEVVYEIAPGRFVLLEPELVNTSAYVALLF